MTDNEKAIAEIKQIYGMLAPDKQKALDLAIKALNKKRPCDLCAITEEIDHTVCLLCPAKGVDDE